MNAQVQYAGGQFPTVKKVYLNTAATVKAGYVVCYDHTATVNAADPKDELGVRVVKPVTANLNLFAGVVAPGAHNKTGPGWIEIIEPNRGVIFDMWVKANVVTAFTTALAAQNNEWGFALFTDATLNLPMVAVPVQTGDRSGANEGLLRCMFL